MTYSGWTVLVLNCKKLRRTCCLGSRSTWYHDVREAEGHYTRLLRTISEDEEDTFDGEENLTFKLRMESAIKTSRGGVGGHFNCTMLVNRMQLKSNFTASPRTSRGDDSNDLKTERNNVSSSTGSNSSRPIAPATHRSNADEAELRQQCKEIYDLYRAIAEGRVSLECLLNLSL